MNSRQMGRLGGKVRSEAKTLANRAKMRAYWDAVRAGTAKAPRPRGKANKNKEKPGATAEELPWRSWPGLLSTFIARNRVQRLEVWGPAATHAVPEGRDHRVGILATYESGVFPTPNDLESQRAELEKLLNRSIVLKVRADIEAEADSAESKAILASAVVFFGV